MKKLFLGSILIVVLLGCKLSSPFGIKRFEPAEYTSKTDIANPGQETKIELDDGAAIVIPANAIDSEVSIKIERNPEKANSLPPLGEDVLKVGDFYNFEIDGTINGAVDLVLPFNRDMVPENEAGVLVAAIPTENGWKYIPVVPNGNTVTLYTDQVGDPLIAWHFACIGDRTNLSYDGRPDKNCEEEQAKKLACDPHIALDVVQIGEQIDVTGYVLPVAKNFFGFTVSEPASNIPVKITVNAGWRGSGQSFNVTTDKTGGFTFTVDKENGLAEGWNWVFAKAECDPWWGKIVVESNGYTEFKYIPPVVQQPASTLALQPTEAPIATVTPTTTEIPIPAGAVLLPNFVGQPMDNATKWLEANGFKYTWVDGSSTYDLGIVYRQAPIGERYKVPHRTVVVLFRTTEQTEDLYGCSSPHLTLEEKANCGAHTYRVVCTAFRTGQRGCGCEQFESLDIIFSFLNEIVISSTANSETICTNTYLNTYVCDFNQPDTTSILKFSRQGFIDEVISTSSMGNCTWLNEGAIIDP